MATTSSTAQSEVHPPKRGETHIKAPDSKSTKASWRDNFSTHEAKGPGKENWRDATLSEKERWKEWQKAKDEEQARGSAAGYYAQFYKGKGGLGYWLAALW